MTGIKRAIILVLSAAILAAVAAMHVTSVEAAGLTREQKDFLKKKGSIVFISQTHYPPFEFLGPDGDHTGMCIELIRWIATEFGFKAYFTDTSFNQAQEDILSGRADVLTSFFYSKKRDKLFDFTLTLFDVPASIFVDAQRPDIKGMQDLNGKVVAMQKGDYAKEFLESKNIACEFQYTENFAQATDLVASGEADAIIGDEQIVLYHVFSNHLTDEIKKVGAPLYIGQNCMGVKAPGGMLLEIMNAGINMAHKKGIWDQIHRKWLGTTYSEAPSRIQKLFPFVLLSLGAVMLICLFVWIWNVKLRQKVASSTADLARSEKTLRIIWEASPLGIGLTEGGTVKWFNPAMSKMLGYNRQEMIGMDIGMIYRDKRGLELRRQITERLRDSETGYLETQWGRKDGSHFDCRIRFASLRLDNRAMNIAIAEDITAQKQSEKKLRENEAFLNAIIENIPNMIFVKDAHSLKFVRFNKAGEDLLGYSREELLGKSDYDFFPREQADYFIKKDRATFESGQMIDIPKEKIQTRHHGIRILHSQKIPIYDDQGDPHYLLGISEDITEHKAVEKQIKASLKEKEMLLREIHHRVKNNMQVISSLLSLQEEKITAENAFLAFKDAQNRIQSIALVHEILYQSDNLSQIHLKTYLEVLINHIHPIYAPRECPVDIRNASEDITLQIDHAVPFGLAVTELLTNAMKYGAVENKVLEIRVTVRTTPDHTIQVRIADNGSGIDPKINLEETDTLGLKLVRGLVEEQLEGELHLVENSGQGTCWEIEWSAGRVGQEK